MPEMSGNADSLHKVYGYITGLLLALVAIKYQNSTTTPFQEHETTMLFFLVDIFVYGISLFHVEYLNDIVSTRFNFYVCHASGALSCELLLLNLVTPICWIVVNAFSAILVVILVICYQRAPAFGQTQVSLGSNTSSTDVQEEPAGPVTINGADSEEAA